MLSVFNEGIKRKAWNKTREKYIPKERQQNLADTDRGEHIPIKRTGLKSS